MSVEKQINKEKLKSFMRLKPTLQHTASFFDCNESTIVRFIKKNFDQTFFEFRDNQMNNTRHALVQRAISLSMDPENIPPQAIFIFTMKNLCDWSDKNETTHAIKEDNLLFIDDEDPDGDELATPVENASKAD